ncbi:MAG: chromosome partitioning protein ParB [Comamonas sp.]|jgi:hypothetical protein|nr:chromosome partitioning protein ParB [Comamonas sp.]
MRAKQQLQRVLISDLRPTQITVGAIEVAAKRRDWAAMKPKAREQLLNTHWFPTVVGPHGECYIVDHHHLGQALIQEGVKYAWAVQLADFSNMEVQLFWRLMAFRHWAHSFDEHGAQCEYTAIPGRLAALRDDPYRSLAGQVRSHGGFSKESEPYVEFLWADFFRSHFTRDALKPNAKGLLSAKVLAQAIKIAHGSTAQNLPGWTGLLASALPVDASLSTDDKDDPSHGAAKGKVKDKSKQQSKSKSKD